MDELPKDAYEIRTKSYTQKLPNSEILDIVAKMSKVYNRLLSGLDQQRAYLLKLELSPRACPGCGAMINHLDVLGLALDDFDVGESRPDEAYGKCPRCGCVVDKLVPLFGGEGYLWAMNADYFRKLRNLAKKGAGS